METIAPADLAHVAGGWEALAAASATLPTQDAPWAIACAQALGGDPLIALEGEPQAPDAAVALAREGGGLELLGLARLHEPTDLLASSPEALDALVEGLLRARRPLALGRIPAGSPTIAALRRAVGRRGVVRVRETGGHPALELTEAWQEPGGGLSSSRRSSLRRARRKAEQAGEIAVELLAPAPEALPGLLDEAFAVEARSWKGRAGTALALVPQLGAFYRRYAELAAARGILRVELLRIAGEAVAMQLAVEWRRRIWLLKIGYDEARAAASPGQLLLAESIADAARRGLEGYELMGSAAPWTEVWAPDLRPCASVVAYPPGIHSAVALGGLAARAARSRGRARAGSTLRAAERIAARRYVAGPLLEDALREERRYAAAGYATTVGYWYETEDDVRRECLAQAEALAPGGELSVKPPGFGNDAGFAAELLARAGERDLGVHFDAVQPPTAEPVLALAVSLAAGAGGRLGCTLPGGWSRSISDARRAIEHGLRVRIVKSEWAHPDDPGRDPFAGCLEVVDALAGRAAHVAVATHDPRLAGEGLRRLTAAGTPCELQVLHGVRAESVVALARRLGVPIRVYVPYGTGRVPYPTGDWRVHARHLARLAADIVPRPRPRVRG